MASHGGFMASHGGFMASHGGFMASHGAPGMSADGRAMVFARPGALAFGAGELFALQSATHLPGTPSWATVVGNEYWLVLSEESEVDLDAASISFQYMGSQVPEGEEGWLRVYYWDEGTETWEQLPTALDPYHNTASAQVQGPGLYALMSSIEVPLYTTGWNLASYPVYGTRTVTEALQSIDEYYTIVYGYDAQDAGDPWKVYAKGVPEYVEDLHELEFSRGYWISATQPVTWYLRGGSGSVDASGTFGSPPATYYGPALAGSGFVPAAGMQVSAYVNGHRCGQGETLEVGGQIVYSVNVFADVLREGGAAGCGETGDTVTFYVGGQLMGPTAMWNDSRLWKVVLHPDEGRRIYLPLVLKNCR
jgi:hypothetical protein